MDDGEVQSIDFSQCVLAAGPQSGQVSKLAGIGLGTGLMRPALPVEPRYRNRSTIKLLIPSDPIQRRMTITSWLYFEGFC